MLIGRSSTGKDTIYKRLLNSDLCLKSIVLCTTRPMRDSETEGVEYFFKSNEDFEKDRQDGNIIEYRQYNTSQGIWTYYTKAFEKGDEDYIVIGTLQSYKSYVDYYGADVVIPLYISVEEEVLITRALEREKQTGKNFTEMCRRFVADSEDFAESNLSKLGINRQFKNNDLDVCVKELYDYIIENK